MSKVLVDRDLLRDCIAELSDWRMSFPNAHSGMTDRVIGEIDAILAVQPAEAEGVEALTTWRADMEWPDDEMVVRQSDHLAALSAVTAERDRLDEFSDALGQQIADAGKREIAYRAEIDQLRAEVEALRKDKARLNAIEQERWDVRFLSSPNGDAGDSSISIEIVGHFMAEPCERVVGENYSENLRAALDQAMTAEAYPPARPEYDEYGCPVRAAMAAKEG